jgi:hypothetical protein
VIAGIVNRVFLEAAEEEMAQHIPMTLQVRRFHLDISIFLPARQRASNDGEYVECVLNAGHKGRMDASEPRCSEKNENRGLMSEGK